MTEGPWGCLHCEPRAGRPDTQQQPPQCGNTAQEPLLREVPPQGLKSGKAGVFRLGVLSVNEPRACDLDGWAAVLPLEPPTACEKWGWLELVIPFHSLERIGDREEGQDRTVSRFAAPDPEVLRGTLASAGYVVGQEPGSTASPTGGVCQPTLGEAQCRPAPPGHPTPSHSPWKVGTAGPAFIEAAVTRSLPCHSRRLPSVLAGLRPGTAALRKPQRQGEDSLLHS